MSRPMIAMGNFGLSGQIFTKRIEFFIIAVPYYHAIGGESGPPMIQDRCKPPYYTTFILGY